VGSSKKTCLTADSRSGDDQFGVKAAFFFLRVALLFCLSIGGVPFVRSISLCTTHTGVLSVVGCMDVGGSTGIWTGSTASSSSERIIRFGCVVVMSSNSGVFDATIEGIISC
jgi:hypothetical protein